jgi:hypothetical protein
MPACDMGDYDLMALQLSTVYRGLRVGKPHDFYLSSRICIKSNDSTTLKQPLKSLALRYKNKLISCKYLSNKLEMLLK